MRSASTSPGAVIAVLPALTVSGQAAVPAAASEYEFVVEPGAGPKQAPGTKMATDAAEREE